MRYTFILICLLSALDAVGQRKKILEKVAVDLQKETWQWHQGTVTLKDANNTRILGPIQFNEKTQVLSMKNENDSEVLGPSKIMKFEFFDPDIQDYRAFISIDYPINKSFEKEGKFQYHSLDENSSAKTTPSFFEVIREAKNFVLLSSTSPLFLHQEVTGASPFTGEPTYSRIEVAQVISVFFLDANGNLFLFRTNTFIETKEEAKKLYWNFWSLNHLVNSTFDAGDKFLSKMMGSLFDSVKKYMVDNHLNSDNNEDLVKIIDYYKQLEDQER